jgi:hypothetical protein
VEFIVLLNVIVIPIGLVFVGLVSAEEIVTVGDDEGVADC